MSLNLNTVRTPGVYIDEVSTLPPSVAAVETAIPAFVGYTAIANPDGNNIPVKISSFLEYTQKFGGPPEPANLIQGGFPNVTVRDTFKDNFDDNDPPEYVDSTFVKREITIGSQQINPTNNLYFALRHYFSNGGGNCYIVSVGVYAAPDSGALVSGVEALEAEDEPTLIIVPEAHGLNAGYADVYKTALDQCAKLMDRFTILDVPFTNDDDTDIDGFRNANIGDNLRYGAAYYPHLETTVDYNLTEDQYASINVSYEKLLEGGAPSQSDATIGGATLGELDSNLLQQGVLKQIRDTSIILPPSPAMAGIYSRVDNDRGVWKAPANVSVGAIVGPTMKITNNIQDGMNIDATSGKSVNAIRHITGRGTLVWGARTLAGNDNEWRYISVRRFFNFVEESTKKASSQFVFEPNDANTWVKIRAMIENFLTLQWSQGALQGTKPEQAFFVRVGLGETMTTDDILNGRLIVEIGMAVVRPAEFIILRFMHKLPEA